MRVSKEAKAESREKILDAASYLFRENGVAATGVGDVMKAAGLTHGGFYRHFDSKDDLVRAAISAAGLKFKARFQGALEKKGKRAALKQYIRAYLSERHVTSPGRGCIVAALSQEAGVGPGTLHDAIAKSSNGLVTLMADMFDDGDPEAARQKAEGLLAVLVGTVVTARAAAPERRQEILASGRAVVALLIGEDED